MRVGVVEGLQQGRFTSGIRWVVFCPREPLLEQGPGWSSVPPSPTAEGRGTQSRSRRGRGAWDLLEKAFPLLAQGYLSPPPHLWDVKQTFLKVLL